MLEEGILENCQKMGEYFLSRLEGVKKKFPFVKEVRGKGLILGIELKMDGSSVVKEMLKKKILINCTMGNVLRFLPPLIITKEEIDRVVTALEEVFRGIS
jgi:acetylornithine/succinyldiaminopimelate/putrescine aminotransferase